MGPAQACTPVHYVDEAGQELAEEEVVKIRFDAHTYVIVGDVIEAKRLRSMKR